MRKFISVLGKVAAGIALVASANAANAATMIYSGSKLIGIGGLTVGSQVYNVSFNTTFSSTTTPTFLSGFNATQALNAADALSTLLYPIAPQNINGCSSTTLCNVFVPVASTEGGFVLNVNGSYSPFPGYTLTDQFGYTTSLALVDFTSGSNTVAGFEQVLSPSAVPEPSTWLLMMAGFGVAGFALRRGKRTDRRVAFA